MYAVCVHLYVNVYGGEWSHWEGEERAPGTLVLSKDRRLLREMSLKSEAPFLLDLPLQEVCPCPFPGMDYGVRSEALTLGWTLGPVVSARREAELGLRFVFLSHQGSE